MIDCIVTGASVEAASTDVESIFALRLVERALRPWPTVRLSLAAPSIPTLIESFCRSTLAQALLPSSRVLLFAHNQVMPALGCIEALMAALDHGSVSAWACDGTGCGAADYQTMRGLERFAMRRGASSPPSRADTATLPLAMMTTLDALKDDRWRDGTRIHSAWVHDFSGYRAHHRREMLELIPADCRSLLDIGGGEGGFLQAVKACYPACRTALVELSPAACALAESSIDRIWQGDFFRLDINEHFDCITFLDVLEHVVEPQAMLEKARRLLLPGGCVVASIPNVGHWSVVADLLEGRWDYAPAGIHCITHLRFFTRRGITELFEDSGFVVEHWKASRIPPPTWFNPAPMQTELTLDLDNLATVAWHCVARSV